MLRVLSFACLLLLAKISAVAAETPRDLLGNWALEVEGRNLFVIKLEVGPQGLSGTLQRPTTVVLAPSNLGITFSHVQGPIYTSKVTQQRRTSDGIVLSYIPPDGVAKTFLLQSEGNNAARLAFHASDADGPSIILARAKGSAVVPSDWEGGKTYFVRAPADPSNTEIAALFEADQADRKDGAALIEWSLVARRDEARRKRVRELLDEGLLRTADDYYFAAFVFQHGSKSEDFLVAHALSMAAVALGRADASWISSATLDRFLQSIDRPQIFGTQYAVPPEGSVTQGKYDSALIPDSLRRVLGVPTRAQQEVQRKEIQQ